MLRNLFLCIKKLASRWYDVIYNKQITISTKQTYFKLANIPTLCWYWEFGIRSVRPVSPNNILMWSKLFIHRKSESKWQFKRILLLYIMRSLLALIFYIVGFSNGNKLSWEGIFNPWCGSNIPFCLFTPKPVANLLEARSVCFSLKSRSWPVELGGESSKEFLTDYIRKHSLSNIILNAERREEKWFWVQADIS